LGVLQQVAQLVNHLMLANLMHLVGFDQGEMPGIIGKVRQMGPGGTFIPKIGLICASEAEVGTAVFVELSKMRPPVDTFIGRQETK